MSGRIRLMITAVVLGSAMSGVTTIPSVATADPRGSSVIVYQCGPSSQEFCAIDPNGGKPRKLPGRGTLTGLTRDGKTYIFEPGDGSRAAGIFEGRTDGGATRELEPPPYSGGSISPDGRYLLAYAPAPCANALCDGPIDEFDLSAGPSGAPTVIDSNHNTYPGDTTPSDIVDFGWSGETPITAHDTGGFQINNLTSPSWVCIGDQRGHCTLGSSSPQIEITTAQPRTPTGSPDGTMVAMGLQPRVPNNGPATVGIFDARTGKQTFTIGAGSESPNPSFSPDGKQVVYAGASGLEIANLDGPGHRVLVGTGEPLQPFWGGTPPPKAKPKPSRIAPVPVISVPVRSLKTLRRSGHLRARCSLRGAGRVTVRATVTAALARKLHLTSGGRRHHAARARRPAPVTLAHATRTFRRRGRATLTLTFSKKARHALRRVRRLPVTLRVTTTGQHERTRHTSRTFTLR